MKCLTLTFIVLLACLPVVLAQNRMTFTGHTGIVSSVSFSPNKQLLASGGQGAIVKLWNLKSGKEERTFSGHTKDVETIAFSPDGKTLASGSFDGTVKLWDVQSGKQRASYKYGNWVYAVAFSPDGTTVVAGGREGGVKLWQTKGSSRIYERVS